MLFLFISVIVIKRDVSGMIFPGWGHFIVLTLLYVLLLIPVILILKHYETVPTFHEATFVTTLDNMITFSHDLESFYQIPLILSIPLIHLDQTQLHFRCFHG